jgi:hypothetical protein
MMRQRAVQICIIVIAHWCLSFSALAQNRPTQVAGIPINYEESKVGEYNLPNPLILQGGSKVNSKKIWSRKRRKEIYALFEKEQFGEAPPLPPLRYDVIEQGTKVFGDKAIRKQVMVYLTEDKVKHKIKLLLYLPIENPKPCPLFLQISFTPNGRSIDDPGLAQDSMWSREGNKINPQDGRRYTDLKVEKFINEGIAVGTFYYGDIEPDFKKGFKHGIRGKYLPNDFSSDLSYSWGAIAAWTWGLGSVMNYLQKDKNIDSKKVALFGFSRLGKTALWAGASDTRFAAVIASCSGEGGAALSRREFGENIAHMTDSTRYAYQFAANRAKYKNDPASCPIDAHELISLIAPRPILLITGKEDLWSDPKGEYEAAIAATPVYNLFGKKGISISDSHAVNLPIYGDLSYFMHEGAHATPPSAFEVILKFLKMHGF